MEQQEIGGMALFFEKQDAEAAGQLGRDAVARRRHWSVLDDVLH